MKILLIVIDGLGDEKIPELGEKTPLEAAHKPNLDFLAKNGVCGLVQPFQKGEHYPTSEDSHLAIFGYNPEIYNPGRGVLEVLGIGMKPLSKDICLRGNFATVDNNLEVIDRRAGRIEETKDLIKSINDIEIEEVKFLIDKAVSHRIGIIMRGKNLSPKISDSSPDREKIEPLDKTFEAKFTAEVLNRFLEKAHIILKNHPLNKRRIKKNLLPANYILIRGAGSPGQIMSFQEKWQMKPCCIAGGALYKGIAKFLGFDLIKVKGANGLPSTSLKGKIAAAKEALKKYDFVFCHIKATDSLAEDGNFIGKKEFIEKIDENLKEIIDLKNVLIVVTGDHSTCSLLKRHCSELLPVLIYSERSEEQGSAHRAGSYSERSEEQGSAHRAGSYSERSEEQGSAHRAGSYKSGMKGSNIEEFSEKSCRKGKLGKIKQLELLAKILS